MLGHSARGHWFQFGLGTLLLTVTAIAICLGWELHLVHRRRSLCEWVRMNGGVANTDSYFEQVFAKAGVNYKPIEFPRWRAFLGDEAIGCVILPYDCPEEILGNAVSICPEADIYQYLDANPPQRLRSLNYPTRDRGDVK
jgi:hypothetical protein